MKLLFRVLRSARLLPLICVLPAFTQTIPNWQPNTAYPAASLVMFNAVEFKCIQAHTSQVGWEPPNVPALWAQVTGTPAPSPTPTPTPSPSPTPTPIPNPTPSPTPTASPTPTPVPTPLPAPGPTGPDQLKIVFTPGTDNGQTFTATLTVSNPNSSYAWNGSFFDLFNIQCSTTAQLTSANTPNGPAQFINQTGSVILNLTWQSMFPLGLTIPITLQGTDGTSSASLQNCTPNYVRGSTDIYPQYAGLPATWQKSKANLAAADLIADSVSYYQAALPIVGDKMIIYHPPHNTQVELNQVMSMATPVNAVNNLRIWIPSRFMAMGLAFSYEFFKLNPNFLAAIGTKENFSAGLAPPSSGISGNPVTLNGITYSWPIVGNSPDGPFQQETGNFNDVRSFMPDFLPANADHGNYTTINVTSATPDDPVWVSATISAGLSLTVTRETMNAVPADDYLNFIHQIKDPWGEQAINAFAYNRGINSLFLTHLFTANRNQALNSQDIAADFGLAGFGSYVATVRAITDAMNNNTANTYDAMLTFADITTFFTQLRKFYGNGIPSDSDFNAMMADVQMAFNVLAAHWDGRTVSFRYDFLTLLRVAKQYLPQPYNSRPTGSNWYFLVTNATP